MNHEFLPFRRETRYGVKRCDVSGALETARRKNTAVRIGHIRHTPHKDAADPRRKPHKANFRIGRSPFEHERGITLRRSVRDPPLLSTRVSLYTLFAQAPDLSVIFLPLHVGIKTSLSAVAFSFRRISLSRMRNTARLHSALAPTVRSLFWNSYASFSHISLQSKARRYRS